MTTKQKIMIGFIAAILFGIGYNVYLIYGGNSNTALLGGAVPSFIGVLIGYFLFLKKRNKKSD